MVAIKEDTLTLGEELGQGEFGSVLRGTYRGQDGKLLDVAVKTLRVDAMGHGEQVGGVVGQSLLGGIECMAAMKLLAEKLAESRA